MTSSILQQHEGTLTTPSDLEIEMQRAFRTSPQTLFEVWTKPEHMRRWYGATSICGLVAHGVGPS